MKQYIWNDAIGKKSVKEVKTILDFKILKSSPA